MLPIELSWLGLSQVFNNIHFLQEAHIDYNHAEIFRSHAITPQEKLNTSNETSHFTSSQTYKVNYNQVSNPQVAKCSIAKEDSNEDIEVPDSNETPPDADDLMNVPIKDFYDSTMKETYFDTSLGVSPSRQSEDIEKFLADITSTSKLDPDKDIFQNSQNEIRNKKVVWAQNSRRENKTK